MCEREREKALNKFQLDIDTHIHTTIKQTLHAHTQVVAMPYIVKQGRSHTHTHTHTLHSLDHVMAAIRCILTHTTSM